MRPRDEGELQECAGSSRTPRFLRIDVEAGAAVLYFSRNLYFRKSMHRRRHVVCVTYIIVFVIKLYSTVLLMHGTYKYDHWLVKLDH